MTRPALFQRWRHGSGLLLAALALAGQVLLGCLVMPEAAAQGIGAICHADGAAPEGPAPGPAPHHRHGSGCILCPLCAAAAMPGLIPAGPPPVTAPALQPAARAAVPPPARAPPSRPRLAALPRGPPVLT